MARNLSPVLPATLSVVYPVRRCGGAPHEYFPAIYTVSLDLADIEFTDDDITNDGQPEGVDGAVLTFRDSALALFDTAAGPASNKTALAKLTEQIVGDWADWTSWSADIVLNGIAAVQPCGLWDCITFDYTGMDCTTRAQSQPWNGTAVELSHMDPAVSATDCRGFDRYPSILLDVPGGASGQSAQAVMAIEDGRLTAKYDGAAPVSCGCSTNCTTDPPCFGVYDFCDINRSVPIITPIYGAEIDIFNVPSLVFTGDGTPPIAYATVSGGAVTGVTILDGGCCYSAAPTIAFSGGGGTGAAATATIGTQVVQSLMFTGSVTTITVANGGAGYSSSSPPTVFLTAPLVSPTSVQATATATVNASGVVTSIAVTNAGAGYSSPPVVTIEFPSSQALTGTVTLAGGGVSAIAVTTGGSGYIVAPTVSIFGGGGTGAAATATMSSGVVTGISVSAAGTGYTSAPSVLISSPNIVASGTATLTGAAVGSIAVANGGAGYKVAPTVTITGGGGAGAHATASIASGAVTGFTVTAGGGGYTSPPLVTVAPPEIQATATASISPGIGSGYTSDPTLSFSGGGGSGAKAVPYRNPSFPNGLVSLNLIDPGTGYTSVPSVSITGGGATTAATATAVLSGAPVTAISVTGGGSGYASSGTVGSCTVTGIVTGVTVTSGGTGYTSPPGVTFTSSSGSGAAATATLGGNSVLGFSNHYPTTGTGYSGTVTVNFTGGGGFGATGVGVLGTGGVISSVTITNAGTGYTGIPTVSFSGGGGTGASGLATVNAITHHVTGVTFSATGGGYIAAPAVTISGGGGTGATAHTLIDGTGAVSDVIIDMGGSGYTSLPTVSFSGGGGSGASVTPILANDGHVTTVMVTNGGSGYLTPPTVGFTGGGGTSAAATAVLTPKCCITIPAAGTYVVKVTKDPHYVPLVFPLLISCPSMTPLGLNPRPTFTVTAPSSCDPSVDETPTVTVLNGSTVVASGPAGTPFIDKVTPGITYTISGTEDATYPWYQWLVTSYKVTGCVSPSFILGGEGVTLFPLFKSDHSPYFCFCFVPEPISATFTLTDAWLNTTCMLSPAAGAGAPNTTYNGCTGGSLVTGGTAASVTLPYIASFAVTNGGSGYTSGATAVLTGGGVGGGSNDRNGNPVVYPPTTVNIGGAGHNVTSVVLTVPTNVGNGFVTAPTVTITGNPAIIGGPPIGSGATATANLLVGDVVYGLILGSSSVCYVFCDYANVHCCLVPLISNSLTDITAFTVTFGNAIPSGPATFCTHAYGVGGSTIALMP